MSKRTTRTTKKISLLDERLALIASGVITVPCDKWHQPLTQFHNIAQKPVLSCAIEPFEKRPREVRLEQEAWAAEYLFEHNEDVNVYA